jgi:hypothetical protein
MDNFRYVRAQDETHAVAVPATPRPPSRAPTSATSLAGPPLST